MAKVIKNGKAYDSGDVEVFINGVPINVTEITYTTEQEHQLNFTLKNDASSWSQGKKTPTSSIGIMMQDIVVLEDAAKGDLLGAAPFDINVTFTNAYNKIVNDTIIAKFKDQGREVTGDMGLQKNYELFTLDIEFNNV